MPAECKQGVTHAPGPTTSRVSFSTVFPFEALELAIFLSCG